MKKIPAAKTLLAIIPQIDQYRESMKKVNYFDAINSFYGLQDVETLTERIIQKTCLSDQLYNLKIKITRQLDALPEKHSKALKFFYFKNKKPMQIASLMKISERTTFRLLKEGIQKIADCLERIGLNATSFRQLLEHNPWIRAEYGRQLV